VNLRKSKSTRNSLRS